MRKIILSVICFFIFSNILNNNTGVYYTKEYIFSQETEWTIFIKALILVESEGNRLAVGKAASLGILQITPIYVKDVNRILGESKFTLTDRTDIHKSLEMFEIYQSYYNPEKDINKAIKLHNPGANNEYKQKILNKIKSLKNGKNI